MTACNSKSGAGAMVGGRRPIRSSPPTCGCRCQRGFSLLEVLVAFAILALSLGLLIQVFARASHTTALSNGYSRAATLAEANLNAVGIDLPLEPGSHGGEREDGLAWQVLIKPYAPEDLAWEPAADAFEITSAVSWSGGGDRRRQVSLSTLRLAESSDLSDFAAPQVPDLPIPPEDEEDL